MTRTRSTELPAAPAGCPLCSGILHGFSNGAFEFWMSGGGGHDTLKSDDASVMCGGDGNDILVGGAGTPIITGEAGNDYVDGGGSYDSIRGGSDNDVLRHAFGPEGDKVRGDAGNDCLIFVTIAYILGSTCSSGIDRYAAPLGSPSAGRASSCSQLLQRGTPAPRTPSCRAVRSRRSGSVAKSRIPNGSRVTFTAIARDLPRPGYAGPVGYDAYFHAVKLRCTWRYAI